MPELMITESEGGEGKRVPLSEETLVGRNPSCDLPLGGDKVSRQHARIVREENQHYLIDLESANGTLLNGVLLKPNERTLLQHNDRIVIDAWHLRFLETDNLFEKSLREEEEVTDADILEVKLLKKVMEAVDHETIPSLEVLNGMAEGKRFYLPEDMQEAVIGRDPGANFCIDEHVISRHHARVVRRWGGITLVDLESKNGTFVGTRRITEEFLHDGDRIALGTIVLLFRNPQEINLEELSDELAQAKPLKKVAVSRQSSVVSHQKEEEATGSGPEEAQEILKDIAPLQMAPANIYPVPILREKRLTPLEIGLIGLGIAVFCFALITLVNLVME